MQGIKQCNYYLNFLHEHHLHLLNSTKTWKDQIAHLEFVALGSMKNITSVISSQSYGKKKKIFLCEYNPDLQGSIKQQTAIQIALIVQVPIQR